MNIYHVKNVKARDYLDLRNNIISMMKEHDAFTLATGNVLCEDDWNVIVHALSIVAGSELWYEHLGKMCLKEDPNEWAEILTKIRMSKEDTNGDIK